MPVMRYSIADAVASLNRGPLTRVDIDRGVSEVIEVIEIPVDGKDSGTRALIIKGPMSAEDRRAVADLWYLLRNKAQGACDARSERIRAFFKGLWEEEKARPRVAGRPV